MARPARAGRAVTVSLRPLAAADRAWLHAWLPPVAREVTYDPSGLIERAAKERSLCVRVIERDRAPVGVVVYRLNAPKRGAALFELVAMLPRHARRGTGMTAAALAEEEMRAHGVRTAYAPAAEAHGISLYFWIRLGYAPIFRVNGPCDREATAWLRRPLR